MHFYARLYAHTVTYIHQRLQRETIEMHDGKANNEKLRACQIVSRKSAKSLESLQIWCILICILKLWPKHWTKVSQYYWRTVYVVVIRNQMLKHLRYHSAICQLMVISNFNMKQTIVDLHSGKI